jgi:hypothetical protein
MDNPVIADLAPDAEAPILFDGEAMALPPGAVLNDNGSVWLPLAYPCAIKFRQGSTATAREEPFDHLVLRRLTGAEYRKLRSAKDSAAAALALSAGLSPAKLHLLQTVMDATDDAAAGDVVGTLLGVDDFRLGELPPNAEPTDFGVRMTLRVPSHDGDGTTVTELLFKRLTAAQRRQANESPDLLAWAVSYSTGLTPKQAKAVVDNMDAADARAVDGVVIFLSRPGATTGG